MKELVEQESKGTSMMRAHNAFIQTHLAGQQRGSGKWHEFSLWKLAETTLDGPSYLDPTTSLQDLKKITKFSKHTKEIISQIQNEEYSKG